MKHRLKFYRVARRKTSILVFQCVTCKKYYSFRRKSIRKIVVENKIFGKRLRPCEGGI